MSSETILIAEWFNPNPQHFNLHLFSLSGTTKNISATCQQSASLFFFLLSGWQLQLVVCPPTFICALYSNILLAIIPALLLIPLKSKPGADFLWLKLLVPPLFFLADTVPLLYVTPTVIAAASKNLFWILLRRAEGKSVHKIEILLLFTFQHSLRGKKSGKLSPWCLINSDNIPRGREVTRTIFPVIVEKKTEKPKEVRYLLVGDTQFLEAWRENTSTPTSGLWLWGTWVISALCLQESSYKVHLTFKCCKQLIMWPKM